jgi:hypothetical protein
MNSRKSEAGSRGVGKTFAAIVLLATLGAAGLRCATYGYAARGPAPDYSALPIDRMTPQTSVRWSYFWGLKSTVWSPLECSRVDPTGKCLRAWDPCDGHGVGQVDVNLAWYTVPLAFVTLGMAVPTELTIYCSTLVPPDRGP